MNWKMHKINGRTQLDIMDVNSEWGGVKDVNSGWFGVKAGSSIGEFNLG
jgi:hypothetical protein